MKLIRQEQFDLIHAHWIVPQGLIAVLSRILTHQNIPVICTSHGADLYALRGALLKNLKRWTLNRTAAITIVSTAMESSLNSLGIDPNKLSVIPMGTDLHKIFAPAMHSIRKPKTLIFVGRLVEKKGVKHLIDALRFVHRQHPETELLIIGDGPEENALRAHAETVGVLHSTHFLGPLPHDELAVHYQSATLAVFPFVVAGSGDQEGFGLVIVEALGCECPVIASDLPAVHDTITDGVTGQLVPPANSAILAEKIIDLLEKPKLRDSLAQSGRASVVSRFDWQSISLRYTDLLFGLIKDFEHRLGG